MYRPLMCLVVSLCLLLCACSDDTETELDGGVADGHIDAPAEISTGDGPAGDGPAADGSTGDGSVGDAPSDDAPAIDAPSGDMPSGDALIWLDSFLFTDGSDPNNQPLCFNMKSPLACSDGLDNDSDGLVDAKDPECTGPCDNDESSMELDIPGVNMAKCKQDCYWDDDSGEGNDDCIWHHQCDDKAPGSQFQPPCNYDPTFTDCEKTQSDICLQICLPLVPNGCDCFGCCEIYVNGTKYPETVYLGSGTDCTAQAPSMCAPCTQITECMNDCGPCELCLGKTVADIPDWCFAQPSPDGGVGDAGTPGDGPLADGGVVIIPPWCDPGVIPCLENSHCPTGYYCITGCCIKGID